MTPWVRNEVHITQLGPNSADFNAVCSHLAGNEDDLRIEYICTARWGAISYVSHPTRWAQMLDPPWPRLSLFPTIDFLLAVIVSVWPSTERHIDHWWAGTDSTRKDTP